MKNAFLRSTLRCAIFAALAFTAFGPRPSAADDAPSAPSETLSERRLKEIVQNQKILLAQASREGDKLDTESFRVQVQGLCHEYEMLLHDAPDFAPGYVSYGILLYRMGMNRTAVAILLKANQLDPNIALVKNEIGNCLAESGKPLEALNYFLAAVKLEPDEPLYHYELGTLLCEARDDFIKSGDWTPEQIDGTSHNAFKRAAELAPDRLEFTYRYAQSFNDLEKPQWDEALKAWAALEDKAKSPFDRQVYRLQAANVLIKQGRFDHARLLISTVTDPALDGQKQKLVAELPPGPAK